MNIDLSPEEVEMLKDLIEERITELGPEIHHTSTHAYKESLKAQRDQLADMLKRLSTAA